MMKMKISEKAYIWRGLFYISGLLLLALGITLNTKAELGVSPIISVAYVAAVIKDFNFGNTTFVLYASFVAVEILLHTLRYRKAESAPSKETEHASFQSILIKDILQLPLSLVFTRFMNLFSGYIPDCVADCAGTFWGSFPGRIIVLLLAIILTGIGAVLSLDMRIIPNPGDGIVQALSDCIQKNVGFTKNCFDACCITITIIASLLFAGHLIGVGIGTVFAVIGVGRVMALFNHFFLKKLTTLCDI